MTEMTKWSWKQMMKLAQSLNIHSLKNSWICGLQLALNSISRKNREIKLFNLILSSIHGKIREIVFSNLQIQFHGKKPWSLIIQLDLKSNSRKKKIMKLCKIATCSNKSNFTEKSVKSWFVTYPKWISFNFMRKTWKCKRIC